MPPGSLPLKVQVAIRDNWTKDETPAHEAMRALKETLGHEVIVEPDWRLLLEELDSVYTDKSMVVVAVTLCIEAWCRSMIELLEDETANEEWTETVLEHVGSRLRLFLEVSPSEKGSTAWSNERSGFVLAIPKKLVTHNAELYPTFRGELLSCFTEDGKKKAAIPVRGGSSSMAASAAADDWADVGMDVQTGTPRVIDKPAAAVAATAIPAGIVPTASANKRPVPEFMPKAKTMPRPDELFLQPPYHLIVRAAAGNEVHVQCSHSPTLEFLNEYFKRFVRTNHQDVRSPPIVEVNLRQSAFGLGLMYDRLVLVAEGRYGNQYAVNPTLVLALVESALGYEEVGVDPGASTWTYRRDQPFRI